MNMSVDGSANRAGTTDLAATENGLPVPLEAGGVSAVIGVAISGIIGCIKKCAARRWSEAEPKHRRGSRRVPSGATKRKRSDAVIGWRIIYPVPKCGVVNQRDGHFVGAGERAERRGKARSACKAVCLVPR